LRRLPGAFQELWTAEFQENNALLLGKENEALGPFWKSHGNRVFFGRLLKIFNNNQKWLAPFVMAISSGLSMIELSVLRNTKKSFGSSGSGR
jgi:hypothetical protein